MAHARCAARTVRSTSRRRCRASAALGDEVHVRRTRSGRASKKPRSVRRRECAATVARRRRAGRASARRIRRRRNSGAPSVGRVAQAELDLQVFDAGHALPRRETARRRATSVSDFTRSAGQPGGPPNCSRCSRCALRDRALRSRIRRARARGRRRTVQRSRCAVESPRIQLQPAGARRGSLQRGVAHGERIRARACATGAGRRARSRARPRPRAKVLLPLHGQLQVDGEVHAAVVSAGGQLRRPARRRAPRPAGAARRPSRPPRRRAEPRRGCIVKPKNPACSMSGTNTDSAWRALSCRRARLSLVANSRRQRCEHREESREQQQARAPVTIMSSSRLKPARHFAAPRSARHRRRQQMSARRLRARRPGTAPAQRDGVAIGGGGADGGLEFDPWPMSPVRAAMRCAALTKCARSAAASSRGVAGRGEIAAGGHGRDVARMS